MGTKFLACDFPHDPQPPAANDCFRACHCVGQRGDEGQLHIAFELSRE